MVVSYRLYVCIINIEKFVISSADIAQWHPSADNLSGAEITASVLLNHARRLALTGTFIDLFLCVSCKPVIVSDVLKVCNHKPFASSKQYSLHFRQSRQT